MINCIALNRIWFLTNHLDFPNDSGMHGRKQSPSSPTQRASIIPSVYDFLLKSILGPCAGNRVGKIYWLRQLLMPLRNKEAIWGGFWFSQFMD
jgi:hypothetical protein